MAPALLTRWSWRHPYTTRLPTEKPDEPKKKELVGRFKNGGREWQPRGQPEQVQVHDFVTEQ